MNEEEARAQDYIPFVPNSVNILTASTNSGKTTFLINTLKHIKSYYSGPVEGVIVILCNPCVDGDIYKQLQSDIFSVEIEYCETFESSTLKENFVVIFEDVSELSPIILECCNVKAHHLNLASIFIVVQFALDNQFKPLLSVAQNIIFSYLGVNGVRLSKYINKYYTAGQDLKDYLTHITLNSAKLNNLLLLQLNQIARLDQPNFFAIAGIDNMYKNDPSTPALVFPQLNKQQAFIDAYDDNEAELTIDPTTLPQDAYILVPVKNVKKRSQRLKEETSHEKKWNDLNDIIKQEIQLNMKLKKQQPALQIVSKMLRYSDFSFSRDGSLVMIKGHPKTSVPLLDFLQVAARPSVPNEKPNPVFVLFVKTLLSRGAPTSMILNKFLLSKNNNVVVKKMKFGKMNKMVKE
jgi:hypothetical protein